VGDFPVGEGGQVIALCTAPARCAALESALADLSAQLAAAMGREQQAAARLALRDQEIAALRTELDKVRADYQFYYQGYCAKCAERT
jgi:hypothetical protein